LNTSFQLYCLIFIRFKQQPGRAGTVIENGCIITSPCANLKYFTFYIWFYLPGEISLPVNSLAEHDQFFAGVYIFLAHLLNGFNLAGIIFIMVGGYKFPLRLGREIQKYGE
jgi:hypothetical protein